MDPLSITASAVAIIQLTTDLLRGTKSFYKSVKNAPKNIADLVDELTSLGSILEHLKSIAQSAGISRTSQITATREAGSQ